MKQLKYNLIVITNLAYAGGLPLGEVIRQVGFNRFSIYYFFFLPIHIERLNFFACTTYRKCGAFPFFALEKTQFIC